LLPVAAIVCKIRLVVSGAFPCFWLELAPTLQVGDAAFVYIRLACFVAVVERFCSFRSFVLVYALLVAFPSERLIVLGWLLAAGSQRLPHASHAVGFGRGLRSLLFCYASGLAKHSPED